MNTLPLELRPLRAILNRLAATLPDQAIGQTVAEWCVREGLPMPATTPARAAVHEVSEMFFVRAPQVMR